MNELMTASDCTKLQLSMRNEKITRFMHDQATINAKQMRIK